jgi:hypothetical protein
VSSIDHREETRYRQDVLVSYRAWLAYLEAQQLLLATSGEAQEGPDIFEGLGRAAEQAEAARRRIAALPPEKRELFDAIVETDRQRIQRQLDAEAPLRGGTVKRADPDEVARRALTRLLEEARGLHRDDRRGMVPRGKPDAVKWLALDLSDLAQAPPSETDYELAAGRQDARRGLILNLVFAALAVAAIPVLMFLLRQPTAQRADVGLPIGNGAALTPWPVTGVAAGDGAWVLPVERAPSRWPAACASEPASAACWLDGSFRPLQMCLPAERLVELATLRVEASGGLPSRVFAMQADLNGADLVVAPCADDDGSVALLGGRLQAVEPSPELALGVEASAGFRVTEIATQGRGEDPSIATGLLRLSVVVHDPDTRRDWGALAPTLLLADGSTASPSGSVQDGELRRLSYLIPDQTEPFDVRWQVTLADQVVRYRATLEPPPSRDRVLRTRLRVEDLAVTPSQQTMAVRLTLHNTAATPLVVEAADFGFQTSASRRELAAPTLRQPLAPDERRVVTLDLPLESGVLQIGPFRYELSVRR